MGRTADVSKLSQIFAKASSGLDFNDQSGILRKAAEAVRDQKELELVKMLKKSGKCIGETSDCRCGKLHIPDICEFIVSHDYDESKKCLVKKWMVRVDTMAHAITQNRRLLFSTIAYNLLVSGFHGQMKENSFTYYEFDFEGTVYRSEIQKHSQHSPKYLMQTAFKNTRETDLPRAFFLTTYSIGSDEFETLDGAAPKFLAARDMVKKLDKQVVSSLKKLDRVAFSKLALEVTRLMMPGIGRTISNKVVIEEEESEEEFDIDLAIKNIERVEWHNFGPGDYLKHKVTLTNDIMAKLKSRKIWFGDIADALLEKAYPGIKYVFGKVYGYDIVFGDTRMYHSEDWVRKDDDKDWKKLFGDRKLGPLPNQFEMTILTVDSRNFGGDLELTKQFLLCMTHAVHNKVMVDGIPLRHHWLSSKKEESVSTRRVHSESESSSSSDEITKIVTSNDKHIIRIPNDNFKQEINPQQKKAKNVDPERDTSDSSSKSVTPTDGSNFSFTSENFKYKTKLQKKAKTRTVTARDAYQIVESRVKLETKKGLIKCFTVDLNQKFLEQAKDQKFIISTVFCDILKENENQKPKRINVKLFSGDNILAAQFDKEAKYTPEDFMKQLFSKEGNAVQSQVMLEVHYRYLN